MTAFEVEVPPAIAEATDQILLSVAPRRHATLIHQAAVQLEASDLEVIFCNMLVDCWKGRVTGRVMPETIRIHQEKGRLVPLAITRDLGPVWRYASPEAAATSLESVEVHHPKKGFFSRPDPPSSAERAARCWEIGISFLTILLRMRGVKLPALAFLQHYSVVPSPTDSVAVKYESDFEKLLTALADLTPTEQHKWNRKVERLLVDILKANKSESMANLVYLIKVCLTIDPVAREKEAAIWVEKLLAQKKHHSRFFKSKKALKLPTNGLTKKISRKNTTQSQ